MEFKKFPSIPNLRNFRKENKGITELDVYFSEKLHGTNGCVIIDYENNEVEFQSRNRMLTENSGDNAGFRTEMSTRIDALKVVLTSFYGVFSGNTKQVYVYGEWCGKKIQKGSIFDDIETYDKLFFIFPRILVQDLEGNWYWKKYEVRNNRLLQGIGVIPEFEARVNLDFIEEKVEQTKVSYVAQDFFEVISEKTEGQVFYNPEYGYFKVVREDFKQHKKVPKPKKEVTPIPENELLEVIEEWRLRQFLDEFKLQDKTDYKDISEYIKTIHQDIQKENKDKYEALKEKYGKAVDKSISRYAVSVFKREFKL